MRTMPIPGPGAHAPAPQPATWFEAASEFGPLRLAIGAPSRHAADAAIAFEACEDLLGAIDAWAGSAPAWRWRAAPPAAVPRGGFVTLPWRGGAVLWTVPWAWLRALPAPPAALAAGIQWPAVAAALAVSQFFVDGDDLDALEPGGAVVLPASMHAPWRAWLRAADEPALHGLGVVVTLPPPWADPQQPAGPAMPPTGDPAGAACEVRLGTEQPLVLTADRLTGWRADALDALGPIAPQASLWRCAGERHAPRRLATGKLMPWGDGWALALESVDG